jgi:hypothetical protein
MTCKCPTCKKGFLEATELLEHFFSGSDSSHEKWLESYCNSKKIDYARLILERLNGDPNANKMLAASLIRDFCGK